MASTERLLDAVFDHVPVGLAVVGADLRYRRVNRFLAQINGRSPEEHVGRTVAEVAGEAGGGLEDMVRGVVEGGEPVLGLQLSGPTPVEPDARRHFISDYVAVTAENGEPAVLAVVSEVTGERRAGERAAAASSLLDAVYAATPVGLGFWTTDLRFARVNEELARINGRPVEEHLGRTLAEVLGPFAAAVEAPMREAMESRRPVHVTHAGQRVTGREPVPQDYEVSYYPVIGDDGDLLGIGGVVLDVTERQAAEAERARLLKDALAARAHSEAAQLRAEEAQRLAEEARARTEFLADAGHRLAASMDIGATLQAIADLTVPGLADWCLMTLVGTGGHLENVAAAHATAEGRRLVEEFSRGDPLDPAASTGVAEVIRSGEAQVIDEITDDMIAAALRDPEHVDVVRSLGVGTALVLPLAASGQTIGALSLVRGWRRPFSDDDMLLARELAARAALHVNHARLYSERSHIARTLQAGLLPRRLPDIPGLEVAARYEAAGTENLVGGDFYDVFAVPGDAWAALVGDVSGKGPEAAAVTSLARHTLRTLLSQGAGLAGALEALNVALREQASDRFCTVICARLEPATGSARVQIAAAGHPPPLVRRSDGSVAALQASGTLLGALARNVVGERADRLEAGDLLLLYTDGLVELRGQTSEFGERWLPRALAGAPAGPLDGVLERLMQGAVDLQGGRARDDLAVLALRVVGA